MKYPIVVLNATVKPYVETHAIGRVWIGVAVLTCVIELIGAGRRRHEATKRDQGSQFVLRITVIPGVLLMVYSIRAIPAAQIRPPLVAAVVGIVLFASGEALRVWSKIALGRYFTYTVMTSSDQPVITTGPYRFVRHPSYTGILLLAIGAGVTYGNWLGVGSVTVGALAGLLYRIRIEEKALFEDLGEPYRKFAAHRKRLIPFVW